MPFQIKKDKANVTRYIMVVDSGDGTPETSATITGFDLQYTRFGAAPATKVDATALAATDCTHADSKMFEIDSTSSPGLYRVDWPDAAFATGVDGVVLVVSGTGFHPSVEIIHLVDYDPQSATDLGLSSVTSILADTNEVQADDVPGLISALNNLSAANVNTEVDTALGTTTYAELSGVPAATSTLADKINWIFQMMRNKIDDHGAQQQVFKDDASTVLGTAAITDAAGTTTRGEYA